jgi:hypothetical protein
VNVYYQSVDNILSFPPLFKNIKNKTSISCHISVFDTCPLRCRKELTLIDVGDRVLGKYLVACNNLYFSPDVIGVMK